MRFKPMLAVDATDHLDNLKYPKSASFKLDGIRVLFHPDLGIVSRSLKPIQNKQIQEKFQYMQSKAIQTGHIFDGEFYSDELSFQEITSTIMTQDFFDEKTLKKYRKEYGEAAHTEIMRLITQIEFHCFEVHSLRMPEVPFTNRLDMIQNIADIHPATIPVKQYVVNSPEEVRYLFDFALKKGCEGLILRDFGSPYKYGRSTLKEEYMLKVKPFETFDARIIDVIQATTVSEHANIEINELGYSKTSRKKDDRILIDKAACFLVEYKGQKQKVSIALPDSEKIQIWAKKEQYIGKMIEYKGMIIGSKDLIRHPVFVRFREDRE